MPTAVRSALQHARLIADELGGHWYAQSNNNSAIASLVGPDGLTVEVHLDSTNQSVNLIALTPWWVVVPTHREHRAAISAPVGEPATVAARIRDELVPAWKEKTQILETRTSRVKAALAELAEHATTITGTRYPVELSAPPGTATVHWPEGSAHLRVGPDRHAEATDVILKDLDGPTMLRVLNEAFAATRQRISEQTAALIDALRSATGPKAVKVSIAAVIADTPQAEAIYDPARTTVHHADGTTRPANLTGTPAADALAHLTVLLRARKGDTLTADLTAATLSRS